MRRQLNDFPHAVERQSIFLRSEVKADQGNFFLWRDRRLRRRRDCNRSGRRRSRTGNAQLAEISQQSLRIQYFDRAFALGTFNDADEQRGIYTARTRVAVFDPLSRQGHKVLDPVYGEGDRSSLVDDDDPHRVVKWRVGEAKHLPYTDHGKYRAMKVGQTEKTARAEGHVSEVRHAQDFADRIKPKRKRLVGDAKDDKMRC